MRFKLILVPKSENKVVPVNYQYPLSAAIYKVLAKADTEYAMFLHEKGYRVGDDSLKNFKLFTFSDLRMKFTLKGDRMELHSNPELVVSFHLPQAAEYFVKGLFINRKIDIADKKSKAHFLVSQVEALPCLNIKSGLVSTVTFELLSMAVCGKKNNKNLYDFLSPEDNDWPSMMRSNWREKCRSAGWELSQEEIDSMNIRPVLDNKKPKSRLIAIKAGTEAQTRIKGYYGFRISATGPAKALALLYNTGGGIYNSSGCGCLQDDSVSKR